MLVLARVSGEVEPEVEAGLLSRSACPLCSEPVADDSHALKRCTRADVPSPYSSSADSAPELLLLLLLLLLPAAAAAVPLRTQHDR
eukprot:COSAG01_NODE_3006_length_6731_cov_4.916918_4_plen_86_part_00